MKKSANDQIYSTHSCYTGPLNDRHYPLLLLTLKLYYECWEGLNRCYKAEVFNNYLIKSFVSSPSFIVYSNNLCLSVEHYPISDIECINEFNEV